jgi:hypothetical protein
MKTSHGVPSSALSADSVLILALSDGSVELRLLDTRLSLLQKLTTKIHLQGPVDRCGRPRICALDVGPTEAPVLVAVTHCDGSIEVHALPGIDWNVGLLGAVGEYVDSKLKMMKGTVHHAQSVAVSTFDRAKDLANAAKDVAGEALSAINNFMYRT